MKKSIVIVYVFFCFSFSLKAQEVKEVDESKNSQLMGGAGLSLGYGYMDVSKLHVFVPDKVSRFSNHHFIVGGSGFAIRNKFVYGVTGYAITGDLIDTDSINVSLNGGVGTFDFGYLFLDKKKIKIYPMIGIGGSGFGMHIVKNKDVSVSHISNNPDQEIKISKGGFVADLSLNINITPSRDEKDNSCAGIMTGLKVGYVYSLPSSDWRFSGGDIIGGPNFGLNMVYVKLILGGFGYQKKS
jgi:hypothetical protein